MGYSTLSPTSNNRWLRPDERISLFVLRNGMCEAIRILRLNANHIQGDHFFLFQKNIFALGTGDYARHRQA